MSYTRSLVYRVPFTKRKWQNTEQSAVNAYNNCRSFSNERAFCVISGLSLERAEDWFPGNNGVTTS